MYSRSTAPTHTASPEAEWVRSAVSCFDGILSLPPSLPLTHASTDDVPSLADRSVGPSVRLFLSVRVCVHGTTRGSGAALNAIRHTNRQTDTTANRIEAFI